MRHFGVAGTAMLVCGLMLLSGCGKKFDIVPVTGTVTSDGKPVYRAVVTFHCDSFRPGTAVTDENGRYVLSTHRDGDGVHAGNCKVTIAHLKGKRMGGDATPRSDGRPEPVDDPKWKSMVPKKYFEFNTTPLQVAVTPDGPQTFDFEVGK